MRKYGRVSFSRKAESIYTAAKKNDVDFERKSNISRVRRSENSFDEHMKRMAAVKACYVYINGISMPVLKA